MLPNVISKSDDRLTLSLKSCLCNNCTNAARRMFSLLSWSGALAAAQGHGLTELRGMARRDVVRLCDEMVE